MTALICRGSLTGCFEDYMEFREAVEALRDGEMKKHRKKKLESLSDKTLTDVGPRLQILKD